MLTMKLYEELHEDAVRIRKEVFMDEQGFCNEFDEIDKIAFHAVLYEDDRAAATGRMYYDDKEHHCYVIGRLAVDKACRGKQYGAFGLWKKRQSAGVAEKLDCRRRNRQWVFIKNRALSLWVIIIWMNSVRISGCKRRKLC